MTDDREALLDLVEKQVASDLVREIVNRHAIGPPYRRPKGTPLARG